MFSQYGAESKLGEPEIRSVTALSAVMISAAKKILLERGIYRMFLMLSKKKVARIITKPIAK